MDQKEKQSNLINIRMAPTILGANNTDNRRKDWSSYIITCSDAEPHHLYQKVVKDYFNENGLSKKFQRRAVNFGSGAGNEDIHLINMGWEVLSTDLCPLSFEIITDKTKDSKGKSIFFQGDFMETQLTKKYDLIMSFYALPFGKKQYLDLLLKKIHAHMRIDAIFVANFFGEEHEFVKKNKAYGISQRELLMKLLNHKFKIIEFKNIAYKEEGFSTKGQRINWDVLEVIAKKCIC